MRRARKPYTRQSDTIYWEKPKDMAWVEKYLRDNPGDANPNRMAATYNAVYPNATISSATFRRLISKLEPDRKFDSSRPAPKVNRPAVRALMDRLPAGTIRCTEAADLVEEDQHNEVHTTTVWQAIREVAPERLALQRGGRRRNIEVKTAAKPA